ncbi:hypothetical protein [Tautonia sociabilis]|uniref:Uncharacterized protein n=1 Tax=Tautonia sociabilis TaxID=2080755 RepID=A0A432MNI9_9BACT|nr:hypothetical protein [Tautonia sociabilis]RUL88676.1 hypothetical protein TsocGM_05935 [Tautonia sociabilis]
MGWFGFAKKTTYIVAVSYEGPNRLRLNGNRSEGGKIKKNAAAHEQTVIWMEVTSGGGRVDQGTGPSSARLAPGELEALRRDVHLSSAFKAVVEELDSGRDHASKWYKLGK